MKIVSPSMKSIRRPSRSAIAPAVSTVAASGIVYASTTHCNPLSPVSRPEAIFESAVLMTLTSSINIAVARHATRMVRLRFALPG